MKRQTNRNVFSCHVIGPQGAGKSAFLRGFLGLDLLQQKALMDKSDKFNTDVEGHRSLIGNNGTTANYCVNTLQIYGQEKYLICREVDVFGLTDKLTEPELLCDVVCLMFDLSNPRSFEYVARIFLKHFNDCRLPILVLGSKCDLFQVRQAYVLQPDDFCAKYKLPKPHFFSASASNASQSSNNNVSQEVFIKLGTMAAYPNLRRLVHVLLMRPSTNWVTGNLGLLQRVMPEGTTLVRAGLGLATLALAGLFAIRLLRSVAR